MKVRVGARWYDSKDTSVAAIFTKEEVLALKASVGPTDPEDSVYICYRGPAGYFSSPEEEVQYNTTVGVSLKHPDITKKAPLRHRLYLAVEPFVQSLQRFL